MKFKSSIKTYLPIYNLEFEQLVKFHFYFFYAKFVIINSNFYFYFHFMFIFHFYRFYKLNFIFFYFSNLDLCEFISIKIVALVIK